MKKIASVFYLVTTALCCYGQTNTWSQYNQMPYLQNPALSGIEKHTVIKAAFKKQWASFNGAPETYFVGASLANEIKNIRHKYKSPVRLGFAGYLAQNTYNSINDLHVGLSHATQIPVSSVYYLSLGISVRYDRSKAQVDELLVRDPTDPFYHRYQGDAGRMNYFTMDAGIILYSQKLYIGYAPQQLVRTRFASDIPGNQKSNINHLFSAGYIHRVNSMWELQPGLLFRYQSSLDDYYNISIKARYDERLIAGFSYSQQEYVSLMLGYKISDYLTLNYSYDLSVGKINTLSQGSHEVIVGIMTFRGRNRKAHAAYMW
jgi:type IX secretion system PorP/SprF family membrane protein